MNDDRALHNQTMCLCQCVRLRSDDLLYFTSRAVCNYLRNPVLSSISVVHCSVQGTDSIKQHGEGEDITNHSGHNTIHNHSIWFLSKPQQNIISSEDCRGGQDVAWLCHRHASFHHRRLYLCLLHPRSASDVGAKRGWNIAEHQPTIMDW